MFDFIALLHPLGATALPGGYLILATIILPRALKRLEVSGSRNFESAYERMGTPALIAPIASGIGVAYRTEWSIQ